jgi:hypothetical protein
MTTTGAQAMMRYALLLILTALAPLHARAQDQQMEAAIIAAMKSGDGAAAIKGLIRAGYVNQKPRKRADYVDYRAFNKPLTLAGATLVTIEEEYLTKYIGCCVNEGIGLVARVETDAGALTTLANTAGCAIRDEDAVNESLANSGVRRRGGRHVYISCRANDRK